MRQPRWAPGGNSGPRLRNQARGWLAVDGLGMLSHLPVSHRSRHICPDLAKEGAVVRRICALGLPARNRDDQRQESARHSSKQPRVREQASTRHHYYTDKFNRAHACTRTTTPPHSRTRTDIGNRPLLHALRGRCGWLGLKKQHSEQHRSDSDENLNQEHERETAIL